MVASANVVGQYLNDRRQKSALEFPNVGFPPIYICVIVSGGREGLERVLANDPSRNLLSAAVSIVNPTFVRVFAARFVPIEMSLLDAEDRTARTCCGMVELLK
jgi:hypothetical protein